MDHLGTKGLGAMRSSAVLFFILALLTLSSCSSEKKAEQMTAKIPVRIGGIRHVQDRELVSVSGNGCFA